MKLLYKLGIILLISFAVPFFFADDDSRAVLTQSLPREQAEIAGLTDIQDITKGLKNIINEDSFEKAKNYWQRIYRVIAIKKAVNENLNRDNYVNFSDIAPEMRTAIVAIEDNRFYQHNGVDLEGILRAALVNMQSGSLVEGGSTITQQLVKNLFLSPEKDFFRKTEEIILAIDLELNYSKEEILEMYLNTVYFGSGAYGIGDAADIYFAKTPAVLDLAQSAMLAGVLNAPSLNSPYVNPAAAKKRQNLVLDAMARYGYIDSASAQTAKNAPLHLAH